MFKFLKHFKENKQLKAELRKAQLLQKEAEMARESYKNLIVNITRHAEEANSRAHFHKTRVNELEAKLKIYEELILKGNLK